VGIVVLNAAHGAASRDLLPSGGGDGGQFPTGATRCAGDRNHHSHDYPLLRCPREVNPHYTTTVGGGTHCTARSKTCGTCYNCCDLQKTEARECHCFENYCDVLTEDIKRTCMNDCFGEFLDDCPYQA
jgi:hypothetical protein